MMLTGRKLAEIGELMHGPQWRVWVGEQIERSEKQVRRYERGAAIPRKVRLRLVQVLKERRALYDMHIRDLSA